MYKNIIKDIQDHKDKEQAKIKHNFFKTKKGEYGEGSLFLGVYSSTIRDIVKKYISKIKLSDIQKLLVSRYNEIKQAGLIALSKIYKGSNDDLYVNFYLKNIKYINNWNLVDISAYNIIGKHAYDNKDYNLIKKLIKSNDLWTKRIAVVSMYYFIKRDSFALPKYVFSKLLSDKHHLIQKAIGWMIREIYKVNEEEFYLFMNKYHNKMSKITLSYAMEKLSATEKQSILKN